MAITILAVDDDRSFRGILGSLLSQDSGVDLIGEAENGEEAVRVSRELQPDVVLMDITMPRVNGFDATRKIKSDRPETKVIMLTIYSNDYYERVAIESGADGFIPKKRLSSELLPAIRGLMEPSKTQSSNNNQHGDSVLPSDRGEDLEKDTLPINVIQRETIG